MGQKPSVGVGYQSLTLLDEIKNSFEKDEIAITTREGKPVLELHLHSIHPPKSMCLLRHDKSYRARWVTLAMASDSEVRLSGRLSTHQDFTLVLRTTGMTKWAQEHFLCCCYYYVGVSFIDMKLESVYVIAKPLDNSMDPVSDVLEH